jgi:hypothetical protein
MVVEWFGFKLHLVVDVKHEVVLAYEITDTKAGDGETLPVILEQAQANLPEDRIETLAYDKAADSDDVHTLLSGEGITPLIQMRALWKTEPKTATQPPPRPSLAMHGLIWGLPGASAGLAFAFGLEKRRPSGLALTAGLILQHVHAGFLYPVKTPARAWVRSSRLRIAGSSKG